jgi:hypothetical protein
MGALWKTAETFRIVGVQAEIRNEHLPKTNQEVADTPAFSVVAVSWPKLNRPFILEVEVTVCSDVTEQVASFGKTCDLH